MESGNQIAPDQSEHRITFFQTIVGLDSAEAISHHYHLYLVFSQYILTGYST
jgi:hypothetical protein